MRQNGPVLLTLTTTHRPATDLGYLLFKHPDRVQTFTLSFGSATVFYPEASEERCTVALLVEVDSARLARATERNAPDFSLAGYVNDRSYAASSLLGAALADVFSTARGGRGDAHQALADAALPLEIAVPVLPCDGGPEMARRVFAPLGWQVEAEPIPLDDRFPTWGDSRYVALRLRGELRLADALNQVYVLLPVLDGAKHYWQRGDEVDKLLRSGQGWLATHPERELITRRYLRRSTVLTREALAHLAESDDETPDAFAAGLEEPEDVGEPVGRAGSAAEPGVAHPVNGPEGGAAVDGGGQGGERSEAGGLRGVVPARGRTALKDQRHEAVLAVLTELGARSVIDLGCGPGALLERLVGQHSITRLAGVDVSTQALRQAARRLRLDQLNERQAGRITLFQGALTYLDDRFAGYDAAVLMEVIEHIDPGRLGALERVVFGAARPGAVVVTTPNGEYNVFYAGVTERRHPDHRFEWTRAEFRAWATRVAAEHGYTVAFQLIGQADADHGAPTQMGVFRRD